MINNVISLKIIQRTGYKEYVPLEYMILNDGFMCDELNSWCRVVEIHERRHTKTFIIQVDSTKQEYVATSYNGGTVEFMRLIKQ